MWVVPCHSGAEAGRGLAGLPAAGRRAACLWAAVSCGCSLADLVSCGQQATTRSSVDAWEWQEIRRALRACRRHHYLKACCAAAARSELAPH